MGVCEGPGRDLPLLSALRGAWVGGVGAPGSWRAGELESWRANSVLGRRLLLHLAYCPAGFQSTFDFQLEAPPYPILDSDPNLCFSIIPDTAPYRPGGNNLKKERCPLLVLCFFLYF